MSITYGYDLKENDDIIIPAHKTGEIMSQLILPGAALVNHLPFCMNHYPSLLVEILMAIFSATPPFVDPLV
jgi:hypothetical protein